MDQTIDVLICGAGAAGLALGIELARRNVPFLLIEKAAEPFRGSRGKGIQPRTQEILEDMGIVDRVIAAGGTYPVQRAYKDGGFIDEPMMISTGPTPAEPYSAPVMLPQFLTEGILRDRLAELGCSVQFGHELTGLSQDADGVTAHVKDGTEERIVRAKYLVGADGGRSFVRQTLGIAFPGNTLGIRALVADLTLDGLSDDAWHRWNDGTPDQMSLCPLRGTEMFQLQAPIPLDGDVDLSVTGIRAFIEKRIERSDVQVHSVSWASAYTMNARLADRYRVGRIFLAGDCAHIHPPTGGQGLNTSIQDAYNLGWKLAAALAGARDTMLESYESERRPVAAEVLGLSTKLLDVARSSGNMRRGREVHQLDLSYPDSPLSLQNPNEKRTSISRLYPGDRAPDAPIRGAGGQPTRLFEVFRGTHWTLLGHNVDRSTIAARKQLRIHMIGARGDVVDAFGHIREVYGLEAGWVLIRPDGYISAIVTADQTQVLKQHLDAMLTTIPAVMASSE